MITDGMDRAQVRAPTRARPPTKGLLARTMPTSERGDAQARAILRAGFTVAPLLAGADKFTEWLVDWERYLAPGVARHAPGGARGFMRAAGVVEMAAGLLVAVKPKVGGYVVAGWLAAIVGNLVMQRRYLDVALRDLGLSLGALALARLS